MDYGSHPPPSSHQQSASATVPITSPSQTSTKFRASSSAVEEFAELKDAKSNVSLVSTNRSSGLEAIYKSESSRYDESHAPIRQESIKTEPHGSLYESLAAAAALASHAAPLASSNYFYSYDQAAAPSNYYQHNSYAPSTASNNSYSYSSRVNLETTPAPLNWPHLTVSTAQSSAFAQLTAAQQMIISSQYSHLSPHSYFGSNDLYQTPPFSSHNYYNHSVFQHFGTSTFSLVLRFVKFFSLGPSPQNFKALSAFCQRFRPSRVLRT